AVGRGRVARWQSTVQKLVRVGQQLPEPLNEAFTARPPSAGRWPKGRPSCPALQEFYSLCDGGTFGRYTFGRRRDLQDLHEGAGDAEAGRYLAFGDTEFGHQLVWDSAQDRVGYYDSDGADGLVLSGETGAELMGLPMDEFLSGLFSPPRREWGEVEKMWRLALAALEQLA